MQYGSSNWFNEISKKTYENLAQSYSALMKSNIYSTDGVSRSKEILYWSKASGFSLIYFSSVKKNKSVSSRISLAWPKSYCKHFMSIYIHIRVNNMNTIAFSQDVRFFSVTEIEKIAWSFTYLDHLRMQDCCNGVNNGVNAWFANRRTDV